MVLRVVLLCLVSLSLRGAEAQTVNQKNLARIIRNIETWYSPGKDTQFAVAINIPAKYCTNLKFDFKDLKNILDKPEDVKDAMRRYTIYSGQRLIGATKINIHSEYLLLIKSNPLPPPPVPDVPLMQTLLKRDPRGCVIFYTYNSPCKGTCLNEGNKERNILTALDMLRRHKGPKAFVYNKIFDNDNTDLENYLRKIEGEGNTGTFLYRCYPIRNDRQQFYTCQLCFNGGEAAKECLDPNL